MKETRKDASRKTAANKPGSRQPDFIITKDTKAKDANMGFLFDDLLASEPDVDFDVNFRRAISRELLRHCSRQGLTSGHLAQRADMPLSTLNNVLHGGNANTGILTLLTICKGLGVDLDEVISVAYQQAKSVQNPANNPAD